MVGSFWAFMPAIIAIVLALVTKQVYISLFFGIVVGALMFVGGNPLHALFTVYEVMSNKVGANVPIIVFLVVLGILVVLMQKSGGAKAYGDWAGKKIKSKGGALAATAGLGSLIFVDDYFNCLTVGSVMRPVTDKFKVSRAKLAYIIDATAAPVCIIAPISSWAAAVAGELDGDGLMVFISTIPFNVYALLTLVMVFALCFFKFDFGKMKKNDYIAETTGDLHAGEGGNDEKSEEVKANPKGKVRHLIIPVIILIVCCIGGMLYTGFFYNWGSDIEMTFDADDVIAYDSDADGVRVILRNNDDVFKALDGVPSSFADSGNDYFYYLDDQTYTDPETNEILPCVRFEINRPATITPGAESVTVYAELEAAGYTDVPQSEDFISAFSNCDAGMSLAIGSTIALIIIAIYYMLSGVVSFTEITGSFTEGFKAMVPAILILTFAWSISGIMGAKGGYLDAQAFVETNLAGSSFPTFLFPAIFFVLAGAIAFATGTSWGTFGVLVPIAVTLLGGSGTMAILTVSATLGGAVYGDHISPISDTTILASAGAQCNHVDHVNTQLPYATLVAGIAAVAYIIGGLMADIGLGGDFSGLVTGLILWAVALTLFVGSVILIKFLNKRAEAKNADAE